MNKEVLDSILPTMDTNDIVELVHNHLCGLRVIENKDREDIKVEYGGEVCLGTFAFSYKCRSKARVHKALTNCHHHSQYCDHSIVSWA